MMFIMIAIGVFSLIFCLGLMYIGSISPDPADEDGTQTGETTLYGFEAFESEPSRVSDFSPSECRGSNRSLTGGQEATDAMVTSMAGSSSLQGSSQTSTVPCPDCGELTPVTNRFCEVCGDQLVGHNGPKESGSGLLPISRRRNTPSGLEDEDVYTSEGEKEESSAPRRADEDLL
jgi:hypothetical protein